MVNGSGSVRAPHPLKASNRGSAARQRPDDMRYLNPSEHNFGRDTITANDVPFVVMIVYFYANSYRSGGCPVTDSSGCIRERVFPFPDLSECSERVISRHSSLR